MRVHLHSTRSTLSFNLRRNHGHMKMERLNSFRVLRFARMVWVLVNLCLLSLFPVARGSTRPRHKLIEKRSAPDDDATKLHNVGKCRFY